jgi:hypothetical protein
MSSTRTTRSSKRAKGEMETAMVPRGRPNKRQAREGDAELLERITNKPIPVVPVVIAMDPEFPASSSSSDSDHSNSGSDSGDGIGSNSDSGVIPPEPIYEPGDSVSEPDAIRDNEKNASKGKKAMLLKKINTIRALMMKGENDKALQIISLIIESNMINVEKKTRSPTKYNLFLKERLTEVRKSNPGLPQREIMKICAKEWKDKKVAIGA